MFRFARLTQDKYFGGELGLVVGVGISKRGAHFIDSATSNQPWGFAWSDLEEAGVCLE